MGYGALDSHARTCVLAIHLMIKKHCFICCKVLLLVCFLASTAVFLYSTPLHSFFPLTTLCRFTYSEPLFYTGDRSIDTAESQNHKYSHGDFTSGALGPVLVEILELRKQLTFYHIKISRVVINLNERIWSAPTDKLLKRAKEDE